MISVFPNNKDLQDIAIQEIFDKDMIFIRRNKNDAQKDKFLEARLIRTLNKNIPNSIGQKNIFFNKFSKADKYSTIYILLSTFPSSYQLQDFALNQMQQRWLSSDQAYSLALKILSDNPEQPSAKQLVLKIGRYHFGKMRKGAVTIYDEQAIQNDIQVRLK